MRSTIEEMFVGRYKEWDVGDGRNGGLEMEEMGGWIWRKLEVGRWKKWGW